MVSFAITASVFLAFGYLLGQFASYNLWEVIMSTKAEILENTAAEPWEMPSENPPPKDGTWILAVFEHKFHPNGLPVVVK